MKSGKYKFGIIGLGARAEGFARQLHEGTESAELFGLCDIDADRIAKFCDYCGISNARCFTDPAEFFAQKDMDGVFITTPDFTHREVVLQAVDAGTPFYLEKPMDVTIERCRDILRAAKRSGVRSCMGFNLRASAAYEQIRDTVAAGTLGQIVHIEGLEQLSVPHSASFMRRFHRHRSHSGGLINTKSSHDMDLMQWFIGHQHKLARVAAFGGTNVFLPGKAPATHCHKCPRDIWRACRYRDCAGFVFPVGGKQPIHKTQELDVYGGDLCVYNDDKDLCDNMTVIFEWDSGIRGNFNLQLFQASGHRSTTIWGEDGLLEKKDGKIVVTQSETGNITEMTVKRRPGGHGGTDPYMLARFIDAIESPENDVSGLEGGLAAAIMALKAEEAMLSRTIVEIDPALYTV